jgi:isoquinoline 1-oxidoreductase beta subunit
VGTVGRAGGRQLGSERPASTHTLANQESCWRDGGDVEAALASATTTYDATFEAPFLAHACLEPMNCTAWLRDGRCDVWGPLQQPGGARRTVAEATGLAPEAIAIHPTRIGGGFGRRLLSDLAAEAAVLSRAAGRPVQVVWSREDDIAHDYYRPAVLHRVRAGLDANGRVIAWHHRFVGVSRNAYRLGTEPPESTETYGLFAPRPADAAAAQADSESDFVPCAVPHVRVEFTAVPTAIATGAWRAPAHCVNAFVIESALDELARLAGRDALAIRREVLGRRADFPHLAGEYDPDRAVEALGRAAEAIGWGRPRTKTSNQARRGIALRGTSPFRPTPRSESRSRSLPRARSKSCAPWSRSIAAG